MPDFFHPNFDMDRWFDQERFYAHLKTLAKNGWQWLPPLSVVTKSGIDMPAPVRPEIVVCEIKDPYGNRHSFERSWDRSDYLVLLEIEFAVGMHGRRYLRDGTMRPAFLYS